MLPKISDDQTIFLNYSKYGDWSALTRTLSIIILLGCVMLIEGCGGNLYLHDNARQKAAEDSQIAFNKIKEEAGYQKLLSSYDEQRAAQIELSQLVIDDTNDVQVLTLHDMLWESLIDETQIEFDEAKINLNSAIAVKQTTEEELSKALTKLPIAQKTTLSFIEKINEAALTKARFAATQILLQESLLLILTEEAKAETPKPDRLNEISKTTVNVIEFERPKGDSSVAATNLGLVENIKQMKISELLGINSSFKLFANNSSSTDIQEVVKKALNNFRDLSQPTKAFNLQFQDPGITLTIIGFLQDIARAEEERIGVEINYARKMVNLHGDYISFLGQHIKNLCEDLNKDAPPSCEGGISIVSAGGNLDSTVGETLSKVSRQCQKTALRGESESCLTLRVLYRVLAFNFDNRVIAKNTSNLFKSKLVELEVQKTLADTRINILEREAAISSGLDGLVSFHSGGIDAEDIRNIIGIAQSIGVLVIAGGVL